MLAVGVVAATALAACSAGSDDSTTVEPASTMESTAGTTTIGVSTEAVTSDLPGENSATGVDTSLGCEPRDPSDSREVTVWHSLRNDAGLKFEELVDRYNSLDTGITVRSESQGGYSDVVAALAAATPEDRPDLVLFDQRGVRSLSDSGLFLPPAACVGGSEILDDLVPIIAASYAVGGEVVAMPYNVSTPVLVYNAATVRSAGLDPADPPATLEELTAAAVQVQSSGAATFGFAAHDGYGPWFVMQYNARTDQLTGLPDNGRSEGLMDQVSFANQETVAALEWLQEEVAVGRAVWVGSNVSGADDLIKLVDAEQSVAFTISTSASTGDIIRLLEADSFPGAELGVAPLPGPGSVGGLVGGAGIWLVASADPVQSGSAFEFTDWLLAPAQHAEFSAHTGYSPVRLTELTEPVLVGAWAEYPQLRVGYDQIAGLDPSTVWAGPLWGPGDEIHNLLYSAADEIVNGGSVTAVLETAAAAADELLAAYAAITPAG
jgi:sn-glycerol 3-phosphate transport system substrate-binding protein